MHMANGGDQQQQMQYQQGPPQQVVVQQKKDRGCLTAWWVSLLPDNPFYPIPGSVGRRMRHWRKQQYISDAPLHSPNLKA
jgi:hypothetical protein